MNSLSEELQQLCAELDKHIEQCEICQYASAAQNDEPIESHFFCPVGAPKLRNIWKLAGVKNEDLLS